jgi:hypothetical protein
MLTQRFLGLLIVQAHQLWSLEPVALFCKSSDRAARARLALFHIAYLNGCDTNDLCAAFRWRRMRNGYFRQTVARRHEEWLADEEYRHLFEALTSAAQSLAEGGAPQGQWRADS